MPTKVCSGSFLCDVHRQQKLHDFVVVGNGPSGISLSYLLSGNWPYYNGVSQDEMLHARLMVNPQLSLVQQDLEFLSEGLEGRSSNPVSLLLDCLQHPQADLGLEQPSLLDWRHDQANSVKHVVLGRGKPGGVWQTLNGNLKTVSLGAWMELPNLSMPKWKEHSTALVNKRTSVSNVASYYSDYVDIMGISSSFRNHTVVSSVKQVKKARRRISSAREKYIDCPRNDEPEEDVFSLDEDDLSSQCSSLTRHSVSPSSSERSSVEPIGRDSICRMSDDSSLGGGSTSWICGCSEQPDFECLTSNVRRSEAEAGASCCNDGKRHVVEYQCCPTSQRVIECHLQETEEGVECLCSVKLDGHGGGQCDKDKSADSELNNAISVCLDELSNCDIDTASSTSAQNIFIPGLESDLSLSWDPIINPSLFSFIQRNSFSQCSYRQMLPQQFSCSVKKISPLAEEDEVEEVEEEEEEEHLFEVSGYEINVSETGRRTTEHFTYLTKNVVLATGLDNPNKLNVEGENLGFVLHSLRELEDVVDSGGLTPNSDPILIIGAGLSAADAIISAQGHDIPVIHVFRRAVDDPQLIFNKLPVNLYPEYHNVHKMMADGSLDTNRRIRGEMVDREHPKYRSYSETVVKGISRDRQVSLWGPHTNTQIKVSYVLVLIGASPNLDFLQTETSLGTVDKNNPLSIDVYTHQSLEIPGLFAMGPLTGDNFVRFLQGGALAIASHAYKQKRRRKEE